MKVIDFYSSLFKETQSGSPGVLGTEYSRKLGTYYQWEESIKTLVWFSRVLPQREGELYKGVILSDEPVSLVSKSKIKNGKEAIEKVRKFFRSDIEEEDFCSLVE